MQAVIIELNAGRLSLLVSLFAGPSDRLQSVGRFCMVLPEVQDTWDLLHFFLRENMIWTTL